MKVKEGSPPNLINLAEESRSSENIENVGFDDRYLDSCILKIHTPYSILSFSFCHSVEIVGRMAVNEITDQSTVGKQQSLFAELQGNTEGFEPMRGNVIVSMISGYYGY